MKNLPLSHDNHECAIEQIDLNKPITESDLVYTQENTKVVYSISAIRDLIPLTLKSIISLSRFLDPSYIEVIFTPPWDNNKYVDKIGEYANIIKTENITKPFQLHKEGFGRYGEKISAIYQINEENVIFLDGDTIVKRNPLYLLDGNFEISTRIASGFLELDLEKWTNMFLEIGKIPIPMMNAGLIVFKNGAHKTIMNDALEYFQNIDFIKCHNNYYHKDQYAITLAASGHKIKWMNNTEHSYRWLNESTKTIVLHGERRPLFKELYRMIRMMKNYVTS